MNLTDRAVLITGGRRMGPAIADALVRRGADVCLSYSRDPDDLERALTPSRVSGRRVELSKADLSQAGECERLVDDTAARFGRLDVLIHMASRYESKPFDEMTADDWDRGLAIDARAGFVCAHRAVRHMRAAGGGRIVLFSDWLSASGRPRYPGYLPYYVAKSTVIGLTEALALELAPDILVNAIAPGPIRAPEWLDETEFASVEKATPLGRWGGDQAIAQAVLSLIEADFITGETIRVDGGRHIR
jgi:NAD(P)-dependent dehydrogenase (short-subunit alcohol dehydrogenase family)